ncbi:MAG: hypothetical protein PHE55_14900 [Methylococcaceae bacterium]|nr:hypothetical protein [Methylococcaceae bacterium]
MTPSYPIRHHDPKCSHYWGDKGVNKEDPDQKAEGRRRSYLQILAVLSGIVTAFLAKDYFPSGIVKPTENLSVIGLGLLASGGSGLWNSVLTYVTKIKDIKKVEAETAKQAGK